MKMYHKLALKQIRIPNSTHLSNYKNFLSLVLFKMASYW